MPPPVSTSVIVIVISPRSAGSVVSNSTTSTICSFGHELHKAAVVRVGVRGRLAGPGWLVVRERDPERAAFAGVERMHVAGHVGRHHPRRDLARIEKRAIDPRAGRAHAETDAGRAHAPTLPARGEPSNTL